MGRTSRGPGSAPVGATALKAGVVAERRAVRAVPSGDPDTCNPLPAVLAHLVAVARARMDDRGTVEVQPAGAGRYVVTACRGGRDLVMMFARRRREWVLTAAGMIVNGQPRAVSVRTVTEAMRLLGGQDAAPRPALPGTGGAAAARQRARGEEEHRLASVRPQANPRAARQAPAAGVSPGPFGR